MKMFKSVKRKINLTHFLIANPVFTNNALSSQALTDAAQALSTDFAAQNTPASAKPDLTMAVTRCRRHPLLQATTNSFKS